jgi:hypothetical protein
VPEQLLTAEMHRAASLLGRNWSVKDVAFEIKVSEKTIQRYKKRADFQAAVKEARDRVLDANPTAKSTLESALNATKANGEPDWAIRVKAAQLLLTSADPSAAIESEPDRPAYIYVPPDEAADASDQG